MFWLLLAISLSVTYAYLLFRYLVLWQSIPSAKFAEEGQRPFASVILAARNEEAVIGRCLQSILSQKYPAFEVLLIDDHSEDRTREIAEKFTDPRMKVIPQVQGVQGKKKALKLGIDEARGEIILLTDADCWMGEQWLAQMVQHLMSSGKKILTGPVLIGEGEGWMPAFQRLEMLGLAAISGAGIEGEYHALGNGANLVFFREVFHEVGGYTGNEEIPSGDDLFLIEKIQKRYSMSLGFCKSRRAVVYTSPQPGVRDFILQRLRWASKNSLLKDKSIRHVWSLLWIFHAFLFAGMISLPFVPGYLGLPVTLLLITKVVSELALLVILCRYFQQKGLIRHFPKSFLIYAIYVFGIGILALIQKGYVWKGRKVIVTSRA